MSRLDIEIGRIAGGNPDADPVELASAMIGKFKRDELVDLLADAIATRQREIVRRAETAAFTAAMTERFAPQGSLPIRPAVTTAEQVDAAESFRRLFKEKFSLGDGEKVSWGEATVEQHEQRIAFLIPMRDGLTGTIRRHEEAVSLIRQHGGTCLADLEAAKVAA